MPLHIVLLFPLCHPLLLLQHDFCQHEGVRVSGAEPAKSGDHLLWIPSLLCPCRIATWLSELLPTSGSWWEPVWQWVLRTVCWSDERYVKTIVRFISEVKVQAHVKSPWKANGASSDITGRYLDCCGSTAPAERLSSDSCLSLYLWHWGICWPSSHVSCQAQETALCFLGTSHCGQEQKGSGRRSEKPQRRCCVWMGRSPGFNIPPVQSQVLCLVTCWGEGNGFCEHRARTRSRGHKKANAQFLTTWRRAQSSWPH